jgi:hypothetical protein
MVWPDGVVDGCVWNDKTGIGTTSTFGHAAAMVAIGSGVSGVDHVGFSEPNMPECQAIPAPKVLFGEVPVARVVKLA